MEQRERERGRPNTSGQLFFVNSEDCRESLSPPDKGNGPWSGIEDLQISYRQEVIVPGGLWGLEKNKKQII